MATNTTLKRKDPNAVKNYEVDWGEEYLQGGDTITSSTWFADTGITIDSHTNTTTVATVWLSGGTDGLDYRVTNRITTASGLTDDYSLIMQVRQQ